MNQPSSYKALGKPRVIVIVGPTASGKSALGIWLAQKIGGEIMSADSRQVYKGLDIGTGKVTKREMRGISHHALSVVSPKKQFSVDDFVRLAKHALPSIYGGAHIPIVVGGTGLYVDMLTGRMSYPNVPPNARLRKQLGKKTAPELYKMLQKADPARAKTIERDNPRRLVRALEIAKALGKSPTPNPEPKYEVLWLGLNPSPSTLRANIHKRLLSRMKAGMVAEAKRLHKRGLSYKRMEELGLEYRSLARFLQNKITKQGLVQEIERGNLEYAKRQERWFKRNKNIHWVGSKIEALRLAKTFLSR